MIRDLSTGAGDRNPLTCLCVVHAHLDAVAARWCIRAQGDLVLIRQVLASDPTISRSRAYHRDAIYLAADLTSRIKQVHEHGVAPICRTDSRPVKGQVHPYAGTPVGDRQVVSQEKRERPESPPKGMVNVRAAEAPRRARDDKITKRHSHTPVRPNL